MKKVILAFSLVIFILLILSFSNNQTGKAIFSGSSGSGNTNVGGACSQAPFANDPKAQLCGKGCCFGGFSCYNDQVCCDEKSEEGDGIAGIIYYCKKKCDINNKMKQCGEVCCDLTKGEVCTEQGLFGKTHGVCLKAEQAKNGCNIAAGESMCPLKGELKECCTANQDCKSKKLGLAVTPDFLKKTIWGCSVNKNKNEGCGKNTFCQGKEGEFKDYAICCNPSLHEICANHPNGQPYCYVQKTFPDQKKLSLMNRIRSFFSWS